MTTVYVAMLCGVIAVLYGFVTSRQVLGASAGNEKMQDIASAIQEGAKAYLGRQYTTIAIVGVIVAVVLAATLGTLSTVGFLIGAILSGVAGYVDGASGRRYVVVAIANHANAAAARPAFDALVDWATQD